MADITLDYPSNWSAASALTPGDKPNPVAPKTEAPKPETAKPPVTPQKVEPSVAAETQKKIEALDAESMKLTQPTLKQPEKPKPKMTEPVEMWGSAAMVFAALGGLLTRRPLMTALNAASSALNGFKQKDKEATDAAYKTWEAESKNAMDLAKFQQSAYDTAMANVRHREDLALRTGDLKEREATAKMTSLAHAMQDPIMLDAMNREGLAGAVKVQDAREKQQKAMDEAKILMSKLYGAFSAFQDWEQTPEGLAATPMDKVEKKLEIYNKFDLKGGRYSAQPLAPQQIEFNAQRLANYDMQPPGQFLRRQPGWQEALTRAKEINPDYRESDAPIIQKAKTDLSTGKSAATLRSLTALQQHLTFLETLAKELPNAADARTANEITARLARQFGYSNVTNFDVATEIIGGEVVKAVTGAGGAAGALADRLGVRKEFDGANSKAQIQGAIDTVKTLVGGQAHAIEDQYSFLPKSIRDRFIKPETMSYFTGVKKEPEPTGALKPEVAKALSPEATKTEAPKEAKAAPPVYFMRDGQKVKIHPEGGRWVFEDGSPVAGQK
jgi:hypothetical protein